VSPVARRWLFWTPRVLTILYAAFISLFALDVFAGPVRFPETLVALGMHLIPTAVVLLVLAVAWRWEWIGALAFAVLGVLYLGWSWGRFSWDVYVIIVGPLFVTALLYGIGWRCRAELRRRA
jgi:hypothetical protein